MTYRALISDLDGTLLDTLQDLADSVNAALGRLGLHGHELEAYKYFVGDGRRMMALRALPEDHRDEETLEQLCVYITEEYSFGWTSKTRPYDGIPEMLDTLTSRGIRMAVLSNKPHEYTYPIVTEILSRWSFEVIAGESADFPKKPDTTGVQRILAQMNVKPEECLYIGDSGVDMQTASTAGLFPIGVLWGFRTAEELLENGAKLLVEKPADILALLDN